MMNKNSYKYLILLFLIVIVIVIAFACSKKHKPPTRAFYYWKTTLEFNNAEDSVLRSLHVKNMYTRYFDVEWSSNYNMPIPVGIVRENLYRMAEISEIIPCIYIANEVFAKCNKTELDTLANKIYRKIQFINRTYYRFEIYRVEDSIKLAHKAEYDTLIKNQGSYAFEEKYKLDSIRTDIEKRFSSYEPHEVQIDCDWTEQTKDNYFYFLEKFKHKYKSSLISSTLRLWQYKYRKKVGVPPVDRCMLMCYSVNSPKNYNANNSIAGFEEIKSYIHGADYPLKLDVALPIYNWGILFRDNQFKGILGSVDKKDIAADTINFKKLSDSKFMFNVDTVIGNTYVRYGDELRVEQVYDADLEKIITYLDKNLKLDDKSRVTFFSWDLNYINNYGIKNIEKYYKVFEH